MFGLSSATRDTIAIIDVGSGSAAAAIMQLRSGNAAIVHAATRVSLSFEDRTADQSISAISQAIKEAGEKTFTFYRSMKDHPTPTKLFVFLRVPWSRSKSAESNRKFEEETLVTDKIISQLAKQILTDEKDIDTKNLLEATVMKILLNGYEVSDPKGKRAHDVTVTVLLSDVNLKVKAAVLESAKSVFPSLVPGWRTHSRALLRILGSSTEDWHDSVVVDVGTESTSISVVREGTLSEEISIDDGSRMILKTIAKKGMPEETIALLALLEKDEAGESTEQIRTLIAQAEPDLVRIFGEQFSLMAAQRRLPNKLMLVVHPDLSPMLSRFLSRIDFAQFTITNQPFSVLAIDAKNLSRHVMPGSGVSADPSLSIAAAFVNIEESDLS